MYIRAQTLKDEKQNSTNGTVYQYFHDGPAK